MPSDLVVPIVEIANIREHSNADRLEIAEVLGYQTLILKEQFKVGDKAIYFPVDCVLPDSVIEKYNLAAYLVGKDKNRVKCVKLRGEESFGILVHDDPLLRKYNVGENIAEILGVKKYEPPKRHILGPTKPKTKNIFKLLKHWFITDNLKFKPELKFKKYTDIQNGKIYTDVFDPEEEVIVTEKIHGANARYANIDGNICIGSHNVQRANVQLPTNGLLVQFKKIVCKLFGWPRREDYYTESYWHQPMKNQWLQDFLEQNPEKILFGEIYGGDIQTLTYGISKSQPIEFRAFDIYDIDAMMYIDFDMFEYYCQTYNIPMAPVLFRGKFGDINIKELSEGNSTLEFAKNIREGIVIKPTKERISNKVGRVILKYISNQYLLYRKDGDDFVDE